MAVKGTLKSNGNEILIKQNQIEGLDNFNAATAQTATKALQDGEGRNIYSTYATKEEVANAELGTGSTSADEIYLRLDGSNISDFAGITTDNSIASIDEGGSVNDVKQLKDYFEIDENYSLTGKVKKAVEADKLISKTGYIDDISLSEIFEQDNDGKATNKVKYAIEANKSDLVKGSSSSVYAVVAVPGLYVYSITDSSNSRQLTALLNIVDLSKDSKTCVDFFIGTINEVEGTFLACTLTYKADTGRVELWSNEKVGNNYVLDNICRMIMKYE